VLRDKLKLEKPEALNVGSFKEYKTAKKMHVQKLISPLI